MTMNKPLAIALLAATTALLPGCVSFGAKPPKQLLAISASQKVAAGTLQTSAKGTSVIVATPDTPRSLDTVRIPVQVNATSIAYVKDAQWVDTPRHMFQTILSETISASGGATVIEPGQYSANPARRLDGTLVSFGVDAGAKNAVVTFDATLSSEDGTSIVKKRFTATAPIREIDAKHVGDPINEAANSVVGEVATWVAAGGN